MSGPVAIDPVTSGRQEPRTERVKGIEPSPKAWEAFILPLNYTRIRGNLPTRCGPVKPSVGIASESSASGGIQFSSPLGGRLDGIHHDSSQATTLKCV